MELETRSLQPRFGREVLGVDLACIDDATFEAIYRLWQANPLLLFRRQTLGESELVDYSRRFGELDVLLRDDMLSPRHPEVIYVTHLLRADGTRMGGLGSYELNWHHDQIYRERPPTGSIFHATEMPEDCGRTYWCNTVLAYAALPEALRARIDGSRARCKYGHRPEAGFQRDLRNADAIREMHERTPEVSHPVVLESPVSGERSIYLDPKKTTRIADLSEAATQDLIGELFEHLLREEFVYGHRWRNGDLVMWDNARLLHRREAFDEALPRFAKRTTIYLRGTDFAVPEPRR